MAQRKARSGQVSAETAVGLVAAVLALGAMSHLGHGVGHAIAGDEHTATHHGAMVTSYQAALLDPGVLRAMGETARVVPEWVPAALVEVHTAATELVLGFKHALEDAFAHRAVRSTEGLLPRGVSDPNLLWLRDYAATLVREADGTLSARRFLSTAPDRNAIAATSYRIPLDAKVIGHRERLVNVPTAQVKLLHENGNLVSTGERLIITDLLGRDNAADWNLPHLRRSGYVREADFEKTYARFADALGHDRRSLLVLPSMPGERTGHVDNFVMALGPNEVMVPTIEDQLLAQLGYAHERYLGGEVQRFLHEQAARLAEEGLTVHRLPMAAPTFLMQSDASPVGWWGRVYSPANSLAVDLDGARHVFVPSMDKTMFPEGTHRDLLTSYEAQAEAFFAARGFTPHTMDTTELGAHHGLLRCVSRVCPALAP